MINGVSTAGSAFHPFQISFEIGMTLSRESAINSMMRKLEKKW